MSFIMISKLHIVSGFGFEEENILSQEIDGSDKELEFDLHRFASIMSIRFEPIDNCCVLRINSIVIVREDSSSYEIENYQSNTLLKEGSKLFFATKKPCVFLYLFNQKIQKVIFSFEFLAIGESSFDSILSSIARNIENSFDESQIKQKAKLQELTQKNEVREAYINRLYEKTNSLQIQVEALIYSQSKLIDLKSWKILSLLKLISFDLKRLKRKLITICYFFNREFNLIRKSGLFDPEYYLGQFKDVKKDSLNPIVHYIRIGANRGMNPNILFDTLYYLNQNPDVLESGMNPFAHYIKVGAIENRDPSPLFDSFYYMDQNPDVLESGINPLAHFCQFGLKNEKSTHPLFDPAYYLKQYPDVVESGMNPMVHYITSGADQGRDPSPFFDSSYYMEKNPDVLESGMNPLAHYAWIGSREGRYPNLMIENFHRKPVISIIVPIYKVDEIFLNICVHSVLNQIYNKWELCLIADGSTHGNLKAILKKYSKNDNRIKIKLLDTNRGISSASNEGALLASGEFLTFLNDNDALKTDALYEAVKAINQYKTDIIYSDEAVCDISSHYLRAIHKPEYSPDLLFSHNYITHLLVVKKELYHAVGGFASKYDGSQDYDLILKLTEKTDKICHIPKILYIWRNLFTSTNKDPEAKPCADDAGKMALEAALDRRKIVGSVVKSDRMFYYHVKRDIIKNPLVSIIIPFRDGVELLKKCIEAILQNTTYQKIEIIGIDNGSEKRETSELIDSLRLSDKRIRFYDYDVPFNYSRINNYGVGLAYGEHIVLMNNDIDIITPNWIESLLEHSQREDIGAVGAKLYYADNTIQHAGVIIGIAGFAGHSHRHFKRNESGYANRLMCVQNVSAVSGALMMVKKSLYEEIGGLDEENLGIALNDVDFCLNLRKRGYLNIFTPYCEAYHYESASRGYEESPEKKARFRKEIRYFQGKWKSILADGDPYYNPNLTLDREDFSLK